MAERLRGRTVVLGVTGGIAAYKAVELARLLIKEGAVVKVVMTDAAQRFVTALTFRTISRNPVATSLWSDTESPFPHVSLSEEADVLVVAPATADIIAKYAHGIADDLLSTTLLAARGRVIFAPAMNDRMLNNPATRGNLEVIRRHGAGVFEPGEGELACGEEGQGRMAEPEEILAGVVDELERSRDLEGKRIVVTAGPTREHLDPVRFLSNPSTGRMGFMIADRSARRGAEVTLISGPVDLACPFDVEMVRVVSAEDMKKAVMEAIPGSDALVMAAAVADFRPGRSSKSKIKKEGGIPELKLEPTDDILKAVRGVKGKCLLVGFAAETDNVIENACRKLEQKGLEAIVANQVDLEGSGFAAETNVAAVLCRGGEEGELRMISKTELADTLLDRLSELFR
jgi:phosphopantothenoylcysteine decarboxylase / phosphopantothenate---cysteine ligase